MAVPTETVYGLAADARQPEAVAGIFAAKRRPTSHPLIVHVADVDQVAAWARAVPQAVRLLADAFWPGALTVLLAKSAEVSPGVTGGLGSVAVRVPSHPALRDLLQRVQTGLAAPSANPYRELSPTCASHVLAKLGGRIDAVLDGGACTLGIESTIVDLTGARPTIVRPGPVSVAAIETVLGMPVSTADPSAGVPGGEAVHYQPSAPAFMVTPTELESAIEATRRAGLRAGVLLIEGREAAGATPCQRLRLADDPQDYGAGLYAALHELDGLGIDRILVQSPPDDHGWEPVHNRLQRACMPWPPGGHSPLR